VTDHHRAFPRRNRCFRYQGPSVDTLPIRTTEARVWSTALLGGLCGAFLYHGLGWFFLGVFLPIHPLSHTESSSDGCESLCRIGIIADSSYT